MKRPLACIFLITTIFGLLGIWVIASIDPRPRLKEDPLIEDLRKVIRQKDAEIAKRDARIEMLEQVTIRQREIIAEKRK